MSLKFSFNGNLLADTHQLGPDDRFSYESAEADIEITGIIYRTEEIDYLAGSDQYALVIEENPLLQKNYEIVLNALLTKLDGFTYRPLKFDVIGYPHLWPGDKITKIIDAEGNETCSIITNHTYKLNGNSSLEAKGETETVRGYATGAPFTPSQKRVLQAVAKIEAARQTSALEQAVLQLNELMMNSLGFYSTTVELETGAKITYTHDQPSLEESMIIWTMTEQGFAWTDQGWQGGNPAWQYGVTADGNMIVKLLTARGINADWVKTGVLGADVVFTGILSTVGEDGTVTIENDRIESFKPAGEIVEERLLVIAGGYVFVTDDDGFLNLYGSMLEYTTEKNDTLYSSRLGVDGLKMGAFSLMTGDERDSMRVYYDPVTERGVIYGNAGIEFKDRSLQDNLYLNGKKAAVIIDQGSNDNGSYVRWSNGLQVCTATVTPDRTIKNTEQPFPFPREFIAVPFVRDAHAFGTNIGYQESCASAIVGASSTRWEVAFTKTTTIGATLAMGLFAIGWWK